MAIDFTNGAWALQGMNIARHSRLDAAADTNTGTIGLNADATATSQMPAGWVAHEEGGLIVGTAGGDQGIIGAANEAARAALLQTRTRVSTMWITDPQIGAGATGAVAWIITKNAVAPWQIALTISGTPQALSQSEVYVEYLWSAKAGRA